MVNNATLVISVHDGIAGGDRLVRLLRAVGDGASIAYVQDLLVHPDYQRRCIGSHLLDLALEGTAHVRQTVLMTDAGPITNTWSSCAAVKALPEVTLPAAPPRPPRCGRPLVGLPAGGPSLGIALRP